MEPERFHYDLENCSIKRALDVLGEKWTLLVLREAIYGVRRFDDFARALKCGRGVLSARLKTLIEAGILAPVPNIISTRGASICSRPYMRCRSGGIAGCPRLAVRRQR